VSAFDIQEWIYETLHLQEHEVVMVQIDGLRRHVYIKFREPQRTQAIFTATQGQEDFRYENGEMSKVRIEAVGLAMRRVKVASLPPEAEDKTLKMAMGAYGEIRDIQPETWSYAYRYRVYSGVRVVSMSLTKHISSHVVVAGYRALISYERQPTTCHSCNKPGHLKTVCTHRRRERAESRPATTASWAEVAARGSISNTTTIMDRATDMAAPENMGAVTLHAPESAPTPQKGETGQRGVEAASTMEDEPVLEPTTDTAGKLPHVERRRRTLNNDHPPPSWEELEDRMETPQEKEPVRWQTDNVESGRPIRDNMDVEGVTLEWNTGREEEGRLHLQDGTQERATTTRPKRHQKLKKNKNDDTPPVRRRSRSKTTGTTSL
jgi:hypothetical protein